jgi:hypothetical protein
MSRYEAPNFNDIVVNYGVFGKFIKISALLVRSVFQFNNSNAV